MSKKYTRSTRQFWHNSQTQLAVADIATPGAGIIDL